MLDFYLVRYSRVFKDCNISPQSLEEYLNGGRQDILESFDIFMENIRSKSLKNKNFSIFNKVSEVEANTVIVIGFYLELFEFWGQRSKIKEVCEHYCNAYPNNKIVVQWNHDIDAASIFNFIDDLPNLYVLNFNTSVQHERFIVLPFWTIDYESIDESKTILGNMVCSINNSLRGVLRNTLSKDDRYVIGGGFNSRDYKKILAQSLFTFCPKGNGLSSYRFFEAIQQNSIPVLIADNVILPFGDINYSDFSLRIKESDAGNIEKISSIIDSAPLYLLDNLKKIKSRFTLLGVQDEVYNRLI